VSAKSSTEPHSPTTRTLAKTEVHSFVPYKKTKHSSKWNIDALAIECGRICVNETASGGDCAMVSVADPKKGNSTCSYGSARSAREAITQSSDRHTAVFVDK
jgi:hypothetical protein